MMFEKGKNKNKKANKKVYELLETDVESYRVELDNYSDSVTDSIIAEMSKQNKYELKGNKDDTIGKLLNSAPKTSLSLPFFFEKANTAYSSEVINLKFGYLFIMLFKDGSYLCRIHVSKDTSINPYLDIKASFKQTLPRILRQETVASTSIYSLIRLAKLFIK